MLKSGSGISEDPLWSSSSIGNMSTKSTSERERMKEEAKKKRARQAAAAFPQIQKSGTDYALPEVLFKPRTVPPNADDPLVNRIQSALGSFENLVPAIRKKQLHLLIGIDSSVPGTPEVSEVDFENGFQARLKDGLPYSFPQNHEMPKDVKVEGQVKNHVTHRPRHKESPKLNHSSHITPGKNSAGIRDSQVRPKPPKLNMPSGENAGTGKTSSIKIENILKEMMHGISHPPLTDIQTPVKGSGNKFAFPHPPSKDNTSLNRGRADSQDSNGSRKNDELVKDLIISEDETDEDQTSSNTMPASKHTKLPGMDRSPGLSTSSTSSSEGSSSESDSDTDSSDSDSSHNQEPDSPKRELNLNKTQTSTINSTHVRTKDLDPDTKSQSPLNRKLDSHSRKKRLNSTTSKDDHSASSGHVHTPRSGKTNERVGNKSRDLHVNRKSPSNNIPVSNEMTCSLNFNSDDTDMNHPSENSQIKSEPMTSLKTEPLDSIIKSDPLDAFTADLPSKSAGENAVEGTGILGQEFLEGQVFSDAGPIYLEHMLEGSLFGSSGDIERLEEKLSKPNDYSSYEGGLGPNAEQPMEQKAPPILENPQQILSERSRLLDDTSRDLGEPPQLIEEAPRILDPHLMSGCVNTAPFASNPAMDLDGILDAPGQSIFTMNHMLPTTSISNNTNCLPFSDQGDLMAHEPMSESIENNMNLQNSQGNTPLLEYADAFDVDGNEKGLLTGSNLFSDDLKSGIHSMPNGTSLRIKLPLSKIKLKSQQKYKSGAPHVNRGKSIEQIMEAKKAHEGREYESKHENRRTVGEKSVRSGKRPADMFAHDNATTNELTSGEQRSKVPRSASEDDEEIDVVGFNENSPIKRTTGSKRLNRRTPSVGGSSKTGEKGTETKLNNSKSENTIFSVPREGLNKRRTSLGSEVVNKKGEVTTIPLSIPYVQVPLKPIMSEARRQKLESPTHSQRINGICSPPGKSHSELKVQINLKKLLRIPGGSVKKPPEESLAPTLTFEIPKRPPKSESESSDMVISPIQSSMDNQDPLESNPSFCFNGESPAEEVKPPKPIKTEKEEIPVEKTEVKNRRGRPARRKKEITNPEVCTCGALRKDAARDTIRLGTYRTSYGAYLKEGQRYKHIADCLTNPADKAQKYIESVLSYVEFLIGLEVTGKTKTRQGMDEFMRTNSQCIDLVDHVINHYTRKTNASIHVRDDRFLFLCLRLQSLLYFKLFQIKKESAAKHAKLLSEYFKVYKQPNRRSPTPCRPTIKGSTGTPSPMSPGPSPGGSVASVGSAGSSGSSGSSDKVPAGGTISIPVDMYEKAHQYLTYTKYMLHGLRLWDDADGVVSTCQEFTNNLARRVGYLTTKSTMLHVVDYIRIGLQMIREGDTV